MQPSAEIARVECAKRRRECDLSWPRATLCGDRACRVREMDARVRFVERAKCRRECDLSGSGATLCRDRAGRVRETQARVRSVRCARNPLRRSCASSARNAGESAICSVRARPSAENVRVECAKCRRECDFSGSGATLCGDRVCRVREMQARVRFVPCARNSLRRMCASSARNAGESAICPVPAQPSAEIVHVECAKCRRECVLETCRFTFGGSLVRNARFGDLPLHFWRKSRTKRSFWRLAASLLEEVSCETLVLETGRITFGGSLLRNARFGDLALRLWSWTQTWPVRSANVGREGASRSWTQKWPVCSANVVWERAFRSWSQKWPVCSTNVVRERAFRSWSQKWPVCSANVVRNMLA